MQKHPRTYFDNLVYGTFQKYWESIFSQRNGSRMKKNEIQKILRIDLMHVIFDIF